MDLHKSWLQPELAWVAEWVGYSMWIPKHMREGKSKMYVQDGFSPQVCLEKFLAALGIGRR